MLYLKNAQLHNGSFDNSPFQTSLILICLRKMKSHSLVKNIAEHAIAYLCSQRTTQGSWNYWDRAHPHSKTLPDDLDDTSVVITALSIFNPDLIDESRLISFVQLLVSAEVKEGGPYFTWIVPEHQRVDWDTVDCVVNSNIGFALHINNIQLDPLEEYLNSCISKNTFDSKYYSSLHLYYFLSRWYPHHRETLMRMLVRTYPNVVTHLDRSLFVSTYLQLGGRPEKISHEIKRLSRIQPHQLSSDAFYIESVENGTPVYAQSKALTAACILESLSLVNDRQATPNNLINKVSSIIVRKLRKSPITIKDQLNVLLEKFRSHSKADEIFLLPLLWYKSLHQEFQRTCPQKIILDLCATNVLGWIGYGIYDSIVDGEHNNSLIPLANICTRKVSRRFHKYHNILDTIDFANNWEQSNCKISIINNTFEIPSKLPPYQNLQMLADKSLGHALGPILLTKSHRDIVLKFFSHYLIARQLNDDAHDWFEDLQHGMLNPVSVKVLKKFRILNPLQTHINLETDKTLLRSLFWYESIDSVADDIHYHINQARTVITNSGLMKDLALIEKLLSPLEESAEQALQERDKAIRFIEKYK